MISRKMILVVEDNALNRALLCQILAAEYDVLEAENGQAALDLLKQYGEGVSLILLDIVMPVMDGYTFLSVVKADRSLSSIDLARWMKLSVVAEGVETKEQLERLREIGCDYVQGYFFARPMPSLDFEKLMNEQRLSVTPDAAVGRADQHGSA